MNRRLGFGWTLWFVLCGVLSVSFMAFVCYLAWRLVEHFTQ